MSTPAEMISAASEGLVIDIDFRCAEWAKTFGDIDTLCRNVLSEAFAHLPAEKRPYEVSVVLVGDEEQQRLNRDFRRIDKATNVLSFPALTIEEHASVPLSAPVPLGDIVIAFETTDRERVAQNISLDDHFSHLLVHGMLHLWGFDHQMADEANEMERLEVEILAKMGINNPYADSGDKE